MADPIAEVGEKVAAGVGAAGSAEKLVATSAILQQILSSLTQIAQNPVAAGYTFSKMAGVMDHYVIDRLKTMKNLTEAESRELDKLYQQFQKNNEGMIKFGGAVAGTSLRIAAMTEKLEIAAVKAAKFTSLSGMPGGRTPFDEAVRRQQESLDELIKYGDEFSQDFSASRDKLEIFLKRRGVAGEGDRKGIIESLTGLGEISDTDISGWAQRMDSEFGKLGLTFTKAATWSRDLFSEWQKGALAGQTFGESLEMIGTTTKELVANGVPLDVARQTAVGLSSLAKQGFGDQEIAKLTQLAIKTTNFKDTATQNLFAGMQNAGINKYGNTYEEFSRNLAGMSGVGRIGATQDIYKRLLAAKNVEPGANLGTLPYGQQAPLKAIFGEDLGPAQLLTTIGQINTNLETTAQTVKEINDESMRGGPGSWLPNMEKTLLNATTLFTVVSGIVKKVETSAASAVPKELSYGVGIALPLLLLSDRRTRLMGLALGLKKLTGDQAGGPSVNDRPGVPHVIVDNMPDVEGLAAVSALGGGGAGGALGKGGVLGGWIAQGLDMSKSGWTSAGGLMGKAAIAAILAESFATGYSIGQEIARGYLENYNKEVLKNPRDVGEQLRAAHGSKGFAGGTQQGKITKANAMLTPLLAVNPGLAAIFGFNTYDPAKSLGEAPAGAMPYNPAGGGVNRDTTATLNVVFSDSSGNKLASQMVEVGKQREYRAQMTPGHSSSGSGDY